MGGWINTVIGWITWPTDLIQQGEVQIVNQKLAQQKLREANAVKRYEVSRADLPIHCPMENTTLWNSHPRVYLPIEDTGEARCPYCGALYVLKDED